MRATQRRLAECEPAVLDPIVRAEANDAVAPVHGVHSYTAIVRLGLEGLGLPPKHCAVGNFERRSKTLWMTSVLSVAGGGLGS
jgi:hypothetical protein